MCGEDSRFLREGLCSLVFWLYCSCRLTFSMPTVSLSRLITPFSLSVAAHLSVLVHHRQSPHLAPHCPTNPFLPRMDPEMRTSRAPLATSSLTSRIASMLSSGGVQPQPTLRTPYSTQLHPRKCGRAPDRLVTLRMKIFKELLAGLYGIRFRSRQR